MKGAAARLEPSSYVWVNREHPYHIETILRWGLQEGFRNFIVWGGDGSFHRAVQSFHELDLWSEATAGLVPAGTCNDLARHLGLPIGDIPSALTIAQNPASPIDVGLVSWDGSRGKGSQTFANNAGFGRSLEAVQKGWGPVKSVLSFKKHSLRIGSNERTETGEFLMGVICNGPFFNGGLHFSQDTSCSDGRLDGFLTKTTNRFGLLARLALGRLGRPLGEAGISRFNSPSIAIISQDEMCLQADGEMIAEGARHMTFSVIPQKLKIHR